MKKERKRAETTYTLKGWRKGWGGGGLKGRVRGRGNQWGGEPGGGGRVEGDKYQNYGLHCAKTMLNFDIWK